MQETTQPVPTVNQTAILAIVLVGYLMIVLDISIVITGLPKIRDGLGFSAAGLSWVQNAYTLSFGGLLLLGARAGDILGRRRMFTAGLAVFTVASLAVGLSPSPAWLIAARAVQGVGAAILAPSTLALLSTNFSEGPERTRALAAYAAVAGVGTSLGLVLGGLFAGMLSWRVGFFMNVPVGFVLLGLTRRYLDRTARHPGRFDLAGAVSSTLGMTALVFAVERSAAIGWHNDLTRAALVASVLLLAFFVFNEARVRQPILPLRLLASRERSGAYAARMLFVGAMVGFFFFTTQFLQDVLGFTPTEAGFAFLPLTIPSFASSVFVPTLTRRLGNSGLLATALATAAIGMFWLGQATAASPFLTGIALPMILIGLGNGAALGPLTVAGVAGIAHEDAGAGSGLVSVFHQLGGSLGLATLLVVFTAAAPHALAGRELLAHRIATAFTTGAGFLTLALVVVLVLIVRPAAIQARRHLQPVAVAAGDCQC